MTQRSREPDRVPTLLAEAQVRLEACGIDSARLDCEVLMAHALGIDRGALVALIGAGSAAATLDEDSARAYRRLVKRRALREPVAYITGHREFWSLDLEVGPAVLIPRPETEHLVEEALALLPVPQAEPLTVVDVGTGSGAIAVALAVERPDLRVIAVDSSERALEVARRNAARHEVERRVELVRGDLLSSLASGPGSGRQVAMVVSNPPYVSSQELASLMPEVGRWEPVEALHAGASGLDVIQRLIDQAAGVLRPGGWLLLEVASERAEAARRLVESSGAWDSQALRADLAGLPRVMRCRRRPADPRQT